MRRRTALDFDLTVKESELQILRAAKRYADLKPFVDEFSTKLLTLLAYMPMDEWPGVAMAAFNATAKEMPALAHLYKNP